ncbi:Protein ecdysoneless -like protein [Ceratocystis lukuohia]|uniref:Protein ecdysoneless -like protein n=1 Tax=Ceratocystis lukuohia TaxID=2019550 RepID=A0ABR4MLD4_9PEZI
MSIPSLHEGAESLNGLGLEPDRLLPENTAEYQIFIIGRSLSARQQLLRLQEVRREFVRLRSTLTKEYIWYKDENPLEAKDENGLIYLGGTMEYGDSVDDEWLMVYLLRQLTLLFPDIWARISDSDGEFLLVEAASAVPKWLSPEMDRFRVWLHQGQLLILPPPHVEMSLATASNFKTRTRSAEQHALSLAMAVQSLTQKVCEPMGTGLGSQGGRSTTLSSAEQSSTTSSAAANVYSLYHSDALEKEAFHRLRNFPGQITQMLHHSLITIPRKLAYILHERPKSVAPAVEAFYLRDPVSLNLILSPPTKVSPGTPPLSFPPKDLVTTSVKFTKVLFAQLRSQRFEPPPVWAQSIAHAKERAGKLPQAETLRAVERAELGMKLTTGFEILAAKAAKSDNRLIRELSILLEDIEVDGEDSLPTPEEISKWEGASRDDDDSWLDIDFNEFERELEGKRARENPPTAGVSSSMKDLPGKEDAKGSGFGDSNAQESLRKIVSRFEAFLDDESAGIDGVKIGESDIEDDDEEDGGGSSDDDSSDNGADAHGAGSGSGNESQFDDDADDDEPDVAFDEKAFTDMMREILTLKSSPPKPTQVQAFTPDTKAKSSSSKSTKDRDMEEALELMHQMEAELKGHGALTLDEPTSSGPPKIGTKSSVPKGAPTDTASSAASASRPNAAIENDNRRAELESDGQDDEELDIDFNLARNLLESFKSQGGMSGPTGNLLGLMGLQLPRDEGSQDEE